MLMMGNASRDVVLRVFVAERERKKEGTVGEQRRGGGGGADRGEASEH